jgi:hypothetical protein
VGGGGPRNADFRVGMVGGSYASKELVRNFLASTVVGGTAVTAVGEGAFPPLPYGGDVEYKWELPSAGTYEV